MPLNEEPVVNPDLESALEKVGAGLPKKSEEDQPSYKVLPGSKIPVSKHTGALWQSRKDQGVECRAGAKTNWDEAIRYYEHDQMAYRRSRDSAGNLTHTKTLNNSYTETENVVFANCSIMVPMLYAKNPNISASTENDANADFAKTVEKLGNKLMSMKNAPGLNFKPKMRRAVLTALLTNSGIVKIGWIQKQDSDEAALKQLETLAKKLAEAKGKKEILEIEGEIIALEEKIALLSPSGPTMRCMSPDRIVVDPTSMMPDYSDANWIMEWDMLPTAYINAVYATKQEGSYKSIYQPTHVLNVDSKSVGEHVDDAVNNFKLLSDTGIEGSQHGYSNEKAFKAACYTKVWYVWDKVTRRVLMFADNNWTWPIWVWDDPLKLPRFFPYFKLWFHESTNSNSPKGEVTYYLDQQDAINEIADETRRARAWARRNIFYDSNFISQTDVEKVMDGPDGTARGIKVPEDKKLGDVIFTFPTPSMKFPELFNSDPKFAAINRITGINDAMRGAQYKTNTTNKAIDSYNQNVEVRVDERVDLIEDFIADIMWNISMLCMMNWEAADIAPLVGQQCAGYWQRVTDSRMFDTMMHMRVEGGSINKPNSRGRQQQAVELAQALGQFANAAPAVILVMLKMIERAFPEVIISDEDWQLIQQTMMQALMKAGSGPGGEQQQQEGGADVEAIKQKIASLPPEAKAKLEELVNGGMPPAEALQQIEAAMQQQAQ